MYENKAELTNYYPWKNIYSLTQMLYWKRSPLSLMSYYYPYNIGINIQTQCSGA